MRLVPLTRLSLLTVLVGTSLMSLGAEPVSRDQVVASMKKAATFYRTKAASHGGYVYYYSPDLTQRLGEGKATPQEIWVQPPGTPTVGLAFLRAFEATGDSFYLDGAREAAEALVYGQLASGGWQNCIDFDPAGPRVYLYRNGKGRGANNSTLDDGITQGALRLLMQTDRALRFAHKEIHETAESARSALLAAQFPSGAFPQVWTGPSAAAPVVKAQYPDYDWHTTNRIKNYWDMPTLNDGLAGTVTQALLDGLEIYKDERCRSVLVKLGDFLLLSQMPDPQPAWAQQYDHQMRPIWARKFEPPAIAGRESEDAIQTLLRIHAFTRNAKYLQPIPRALEYLKRSLLPNGQLARYYELKSNKPLYMTRDYKLTYDDADVPQHYGWKTESHLDAIAATYRAQLAGNFTASTPPATDAARVGEILRTLDAEGRWLSTNEGQPLVGHPKFKPGETFIASEVFSANLEALSAYLRTTKSGR